MAPSLIVGEAGGRMTDWAGQALTLHSDGRVIAAAHTDTHLQVLKHFAPKVESRKTTLMPNSLPQNPRNSLLLLRLVRAFNIKVVFR